MNEGIYQLNYASKMQSLARFLPAYLAIYEGKDQDTAISLPVVKVDGDYIVLKPYVIVLHKKPLAQLIKTDILGTDPEIRKIIKNIKKVGSLDDIKEAADFPEWFINPQSFV